jgi:hypothetical protein
MENRMSKCASMSATNVTNDSESSHLLGELPWWQRVRFHVVGGQNIFDAWLA